MCILCSLGNSLTDENIREAQKMCSNPPSIEYQRTQSIFDAFRTLLKVAKRYNFHMEDYFKGIGSDSLDNSYDTSFEVRDARKEFIERLALNVNNAENKELQEIINVVNDVVTATTNGTSSVENIEDLKAFLNQALPAWQNAMQNQTVFQQQFYQFPPRT